MEKYEGTLFAKVEDEIEALISLANKKRQPLWTELNGVKLIAHPGDTQENLMWAFKIAFRHPEIIPRHYVRAADVVALQHTATHLVNSLPGLPFENTAALIQWLCDLQLPSLHTKVRIPRAQVRNLFLENRPTCKGSAETEAWKLVEEAIDGLSYNVSIPPSWRNRAEKWLDMHRS